MKYEFKKRDKKQKIDYKLLIWPISVFCYLMPGFCFVMSVIWLLAPAAHSALLRPLNDLHVIEAEISRQGLTRITVKNDRILNVFGITGEYVLEADEDQGQIFIRPMGPGSLNPISLTLTTEKGHTQDLRLNPKDKAPEALILEAAVSSEEHLTEKTAQDFPSRDAIEELLQACQEDRIPVGYKRMPLDIKAQQGPHRLIREIRNDSLKALPLRGIPLRGLTYEVKNSATIPWILAESEFAQKLDTEVIAILMPKKLLKPGESTYVYVVAKVTE